MSGAGRVAVIGAGTMGAGIAQACAAAGYAVVLIDADAAALERGRAAIERSLARLVRNGVLEDSAAAAALGRIATGSDLAAGVSAADVVIEAVTEDPAVKARVWTQIGQHAPSQALLATNTSSLSVTEIAAYGGAPERSCGLHFFNPVPVLPLIEVVRGERSSDATVARARDFAASLGKTPIVCDDTPGFIVNRLLIPYVNDAAAALGEGLASAHDIDAAMRLGANMPLGPLALADLIGLDVTLAAIEALQRESGDPRYRPAPLLRRLVRAGKLGRKSGEGFFPYDPPPHSRPTRPTEETP